MSRKRNDSETMRVHKVPKIVPGDDMRLLLVISRWSAFGVVGEVFGFLLMGTRMSIG
jgi:hypothetical protein